MTIQMICELCGAPSVEGGVHLYCSDLEQFWADLPSILGDSEFDFMNEDYLE